MKLNDLNMYNGTFEYLKERINITEQMYTSFATSGNLLTPDGCVDWCASTQIVTYHNFGAYLFILAGFSIFMNLIKYAIIINTENLVGKVKVNDQILDYDMLWIIVKVFEILAVAPLVILMVLFIWFKPQLAQVVLE